MIFGRNKKPKKTQTSQEAQSEPVQSSPQSSDQTATVQIEPDEDAAKEMDLRSRRALEAKIISASFGEITSVLMRSNSYKHYSLADLEWLVVPPVLTQQFILAEARKGEDGIPSPVGVAFWASVSSEVDEKLSAIKTGPLKLRPDEWKSGDIFWLIDAVGPQQILNGLIQNLHKNVLKGRPLKLRTKDEQGNPVIKVQKQPLDQP